MDPINKLSSMTIDEDKKEVSSSNGLSSDVLGESSSIERKQTKREGYLTWDEFFMGAAVLASQRSKDPETQVGAVIVNEEKIIVSLGYNGFPRFCSDDALPWSKGMLNPLDNKYFYVTHAEANAIINRNSTSLKGSTIYATLFPCNECSKLIIQSGIKEVVFMHEKPNKPEMVASRRMFDMAGISLRKFETTKESIILKFI